MEDRTHLDQRGRARMVDVGGKSTTRRQATARGTLRLSERSYRALREGRLAKGDALAVARLAGIQAAKRTADWIPLCHPIPLERLEVEVVLVDEDHSAVVTATAAARWRTGVEMEALVAVSASCLSLYDMVKGIDRAARVAEILLLEKHGGRSGSWRRSGP